MGLFLSGSLGRGNDKQVSASALCTFLHWSVYIHRRDQRLLLCFRLFFSSVAGDVRLLKVLRSTYASM